MRSEESERLRDAALASDARNQELLAQQAELEAAISGMAGLRHEIDELEAKIRANDELVQSGQNKKAEIARSIEEALDQRKETFSDLTRLKQERDALAAAVGHLAEQKQELEDARQELASVEARAASLDQRLNEVAHAEAKLQKAQAEFSELSLKNQQGREEYEALRLELATTRKELAQIGPEAKRLNDTRQELESTSKQLAESTAQLEELRLQNAKMDERCAFLKQQTNDLEVREQRFRNISKEHQKLEARVGELRDFQAKHSRVEEALSKSQQAEKHLGTEVKRLRDRKKTLSKAVDTEWGTVHLIAKGIIKRLSLIDDMIARYQSENTGTDVTQQLGLLRDALNDVLMEHSVEPFTYKPGTEIQVADRKRITIVEVNRDAPATPGKTNVLSTLRVGYLCHNDEGSPPTILRKADVVTNEG